MFSSFLHDLSPATMTFIFATGFLGAFLLCLGFIRSQCDQHGRAHGALTALMLMGIYVLYLFIPVGLAYVGSETGRHILDNLNPITIGFIDVIAFFAVYFHWKYTPAIIHKGPAVLTTMGILGTFVGIAIGLSGFDASNVQQSVPALIDGIKTAFWASACGIFFALTLKLRDVLFTSRQVANKTTNATINDLVAALREVQMALVGNDNSTLLQQIRRAHQDSNVRLDMVVRSLDTLKTEGDTLKTRMQMAG